LFEAGKEATAIAPDQRAAEDVHDEFVGALYVYALSLKYAGTSMKVIAAR
jgi:hypothetical protein